MLENISPAKELRSIARRKARGEILKSVRHPLVEEELAKGWTGIKTNRNTTRLSKPKPHHVLLEDQVWTLLYRMGFDYLSSEGGATLVLNSKDPASPRTQIDVVAIDAEVALAIECKSAVTPQKKPRFQEELAKHVAARKKFSEAVKRDFGSEPKRQVAFVMVTSNILLTDKDRARASDASVILFDENDLTYYRALVSQIGPAARYQFLADILPGKVISGLNITVPAVRVRMGAAYCYSFSISPEYLLKIAYVSHRGKGKASDVDTYQRMLKRARLKRIRDYISNDGIFPTNIVVNIPSKWLRFDRGRQEGEKRAAVFGWLTLRPCYKAAWIIDGQHRLYGYSGHAQASESVITVLAFADLPPSEQAKLFVDINAEQKRVKQSLLHELYAELHWDADDAEIRMRAILSKAIQAIDRDPTSPFFDRILKSDETRTATRCITLTSVFRAVEKTGFFISKMKGGSPIEYGPLWAGGNVETMKRTMAVLDAWFDCIRTEASTLWDLGASEGGGLAMNDAVTVCINVLRSVFQDLQRTGYPLVTMSTDELAEQMAPYGHSLGRYFAGMSEQEMRNFRALRGIQGQTAATRRCQAALKTEHPSFAPAGLQDFLDAEAAQTNTKAREVIIRIETGLQQTVLEELKEEFQEDDTWWYVGVPEPVRKKVAERIEEKKGMQGGREANLDLIDYAAIIQTNWILFDKLLGYGKGNKKQRTKWIIEVNNLRQIVMHASKGAHLPVTQAQLAFLQDIESWLGRQVSGSTE